MVVGTHGQAQLGDAVAAVNVLAIIEQRIGAGLREGRVEAVLRVSCAHADLPVEQHVVRRVHRHDEVHRAVTTIDSVQVLGVCCGLCGCEGESVAVVFLTEAERYGNVGSGGLADGEMQHGGAVATVHIRDHMAVVLGLQSFCNGEVVVVVGIAVANVRADFTTFLGPHVQVQVDDAVAAVDARQGSGVVAGCRERHAMEIIFAVETDGIINIRCENRIDGKGERGEAVAAVNIKAVFDESVFASFRKGRVEAVARIVREFAGLVGELRAAERVHGHVEGDGAVAVVDGFEVLRVGETADLAGGHVEVVLGVGVAETERYGNVGGGGLVDGQVQSSDAVATVYIIGGVLVVLTLINLPEVKPVLVKGFPCADFRIEIRRLLRIMGKVECHDTVTAVGGGEVGGVVAFRAH